MSTTQPIRDTEKLEKFKEYYAVEKPNARNYALIIVGLNSALRVSDLLNLKCGDVYDFKRQDFHGHIQIREKKTGKFNQIYINQNIRRALQKHLDFTSPNICAESWVFASPRQKEKHLSRV